MNTKVFRFGCLLALAGSILWFSAPAQAQQRSYSSGSRSGGGMSSFGGMSSSRSGYGSSGSSSSTRQYNNSTMVGDATVTGDLETRRIIVITDEETSQYVSQVISNLDRPKPQVLIKVVFLEVTLNNGLDIGVDGTYKRTDSGITNSFTSSVASAALNNVGASGASGPVGQGLYQVLGNNFSATLRAIASAGKTEVLSRPSILCINNQPATITVGDSVPFITGTTYSANIGQINTVTYKDIGIILRVTPFITSDGLIQMIVNPEISALTDEYVQISSNVNARVYSTRSANTVVVTPDRQPVIIGGMISNEKIQTESKLPLLGDIPWMGALFRRRVNTDAKTELFIFLIPTVVRSPAEMASLTMSEAQKVEMQQTSFEQQELDRFLEGLPVKSPKHATGDKDKKKK